VCVCTQAAIRRESELEILEGFLTLSKDFPPAGVTVKV
jgi:hypothetical protein